MKIYDEDRVLELYKRYGVLKDVEIRTGYSYKKVREILDKNNIKVNRNNEHFNRKISKAWGD